MDIGLLAGGRGARLGRGPKAFVEIAGKPMWRWLCDELSSLTDKPVLMVVPAGLSEVGPGISCIESRGKYLLDMIELTRWKSPDDEMLILNADAVTITKSDIERFLRVVELAGAESTPDFIWPVIERSAIPPERQDWRIVNYVPGTRQRLARGMIMYIRGRVEPNMQIIERMNRHKLLADVIGLGAENVLRTVTGTLTIPHLERRIGTLLGCTAAMMPCSIPSFAMDVDTPDDYDYIEKLLITRLGGE